MTIRPRYENGVPMCSNECPHYEDGDRYSVQFSARCKLDGSVTEPSVVCTPAVAAQAAELERLRDELQSLDLRESARRHLLREAIRDLWLNSRQREILLRIVDSESGLDDGFSPQPQENP